MFLWFLFAPFFTLFMLLIGLQFLYYVAWIAVPALVVALVIWLIYKLVHRSRA